MPRINFALLDASKVIELLEKPTTDRRPLGASLEKHVPVGVLNDALLSATRPFTRELLANILGEVRSPESVTALLAQLGDDNLNARAAATQALGKVFGYVKNPPPLELRASALSALKQSWKNEPEGGMRSTLAQTMALLGDPSVRQVLESAMNDPDRRVRRQVEWGLKYLDELAMRSS